MVQPATHVISLQLVALGSFTCLNSLSDEIFGRDTGRNVGEADLQPVGVHLLSGVELLSCIIATNGSPSD